MCGFDGLLLFGGDVPDVFEGDPLVDMNVFDGVEVYCFLLV